MEDEVDKGITDELRAKVMQIFFQLMRKGGVDLKDETDLYRYQFNAEFGRVTVTFEPGQVLTTWAIQTSQRIFKDILASAAEQSVAQGTLEAVPVEMHIRYDSATPAILAYVLMDSILTKLTSAFRQLGSDAEQIFKGVLITAIKEKTDFQAALGIELPNPAESVKAVSKNFATEYRRYLNKQINRLFPKPQFDNLPQLYPVLLRVWQDVKKIYEQNSESDRWRNMVRAKYDYTFDDDLLTRITGKLEELPEDIQAELAEKDGDHTPNTIALEHAARMCGATPYQYNVRHLHRLKSERVKTDIGETPDVSKTTGGADTSETA